MMRINPDNGGTLKKVTLFILTVSLALFLAACQSATEPEEEPVVSGNTFMFTDSTDTLFVWGTVSIDLNSQIDTTNISDSLVCFLDDVRHSAVYNYQSGPLTFRSIQFASGTYTLRYLLYTTRGANGSSQGQQFVEEISRIIVINNDPPAPSEIVALAPIDGKLQFDWEPYDIFNFQEYRIELKHEVGWGQVTTIVNSKTTTWRHPIFVGGDHQEYRVVVKAADQEAASQPRSPSNTDPLLNPVEVTSDYGMNFSWRRSVFDSAFAAYHLQVYLDESPGSAYQDIAIITDIDSTAFSFSKPLFGNPIHFVIWTESNVRGSNSRFSEQQPAVVGEKINSHRYLRHIPQRDRLFMYREGTAIEYQASTMDSLTTHQVAPDFSKNALLAYQQRPSSSDIEDRKYFSSVDPVTIQQIQEFNTFDFVGYNSYLGDDRLHPDNTGRIWYSGFTFSSPTFFFDKVFLLNLNTGMVEVEFDGKSLISEVSADGNYIVLSSPSPATLYHFDGSQLVALRIIDSPDLFKFHPDNLHYVLIQNQSIQMYDLATNSLVSEVALPEFVQRPDVDILTDYVGCRSVASINGQYTYRVLDISSGEIKKEISLIGGANAQLANGTLFSSRGYFLPLNLE
ncbi:MAG: hypothetical protein ACRBF0_01650 [Calditrichia bacterium]